MTLKEYDVLGLGSVTVDFVGTVKGWPVEGSKQLMEGLTIHDGGLIGTALVAVSRLGGRAAFAGKLGSSDMARRAINALQKEGIDTSLVISEPGAEPIVAFVITNTDSGQRNIFWTRQDACYPMPNELSDLRWYEKTRVLMIDYESGLAGIETAKIASKHNIPVVSDIEGDTPYTAEAMAISTHLIISEDFAQKYTNKGSLQDMLISLRSSNEQVVIITRGPAGCVGLGPQGNFALSAYKVNAVDTTGCGDAFHGAYALALARKMKVIDAAKFASAAAGLCATKLGGRDGLASIEQVNELINSQTI